MTTLTPTLQHPDSGFEQPVRRLDSSWGQTRGAIGRGVGSGLWFDFGERGWRPLHMLGVGLPLIAVWVDGGFVAKVERLPPWIGAGIARASDVFELPPGCELVGALTVGDEVSIE